MYVAHFMVSRAKTPWESGALMDEKLRWNGLQRSLAWNVLSRDRTMQFELEYRQKMVYIYIYNIYVIYVYNIYIYILYFINTIKISKGVVGKKGSMLVIHVIS